MRSAEVVLNSIDHVPVKTHVGQWNSEPSILVNGGEIIVVIILHVSPFITQTE